MHDKLIVICGTGRMARALGRLLYDSGERVAFIAGRDRDRTKNAAGVVGPGVRPVLYENFPDDVSHVLIAVSDSAVSEVATTIAVHARPRAALHTSGVAGPKVLDPLRAAGTACGTLHPLQTVTGCEAGAHGLTSASFGICGDAEALTWARSIVRIAAGTPLVLKPESMPLYHAAAVMASNAVLALLDASQHMLQTAGLEQRSLCALAPLLRASVENAFRLGPEAALTGPVARGDVSTIVAHMGALSAVPQNVQNLYRAAAMQNLDMSRRRGLPCETAEELERCLQA